TRTATGFQPAPEIGPRIKGRAQDYYWSVAGFAGQPVRIALIDRDNRPGCYLVCEGFELVTQDDFAGRLFTEQMLGLVREHGLAPMARFDSKHFLAIGN